MNFYQNYYNINNKLKYLVVDFNDYLDNKLIYIFSHIFNYFKIKNNIDILDFLNKNNWNYKDKYDYKIKNKYCCQCNIYNYSLFTINHVVEQFFISYYCPIGYIDININNYNYNIYYCFNYNHKNVINETILNENLKKILLNPKIHDEKFYIEKILNLQNKKIIYYYDNNGIILKKIYKKKSYIIKNINFKFEECYKFRFNKFEMMFNNLFYDDIKKDFEIKEIKYNNFSKCIKLCLCNYGKHNLNIYKFYLHNIIYIIITILVFETDDEDDLYYYIEINKKYKKLYYIKKIDLSYNPKHYYIYNKKIVKLNFNNKIKYLI